MILNQIGEMALGSRLRMLSEVVTQDAQQIYELYEVELKPKWFPVFYVLSQGHSAKSITEIANEINHSHPSVIKIVREMSRSGLVDEKKDEADGRKNNIYLTPKGVEISIRIKDQYLDVNAAVQKALKQTKHNIWLAMQEFEYLLEEKSLYLRVQEERKIRESANIQIVEYESRFRSDFKKLNEEWITAYFKLEQADSIALDNPEGYILDKGGAILIALDKNEVLGVCALLKMNDENYDYELAKMAVSPMAKGKGIGSLLGKAIVDKARSLGASNIYLESNTILKPAISLYEKLGFKKVAGHPTPYERCNIQMELKLN
ncbi:MAG: bifunctional helix-turn-helix transcriptional regulator/GNAT family N-acetyltransferase [Reichenbachiella sp.]|uniref:bifunctional helix-turn-helix transcriptional regulator/GNAT family N-acetyltransferase n=1 Tax=Reichenbachiella sp. TaxID=2184521 RepID=UPI003264246A